MDDYRNTYSAFSRRRIVRALQKVRKWTEEVESYLGSPNPVLHTWDVSGEVNTLNGAIDELHDALAQGGGKPHLQTQPLKRTP
ncbi:hypothetical protein [Candidatus Cyanaurora vandensis]|uniref:hypothetical protein n=1 Tax=Candidatus Cyanaurora vandensis TaxID=2714958 RepID=UPI00257FCD21|nr:hypothetical protein [Candidatus Cyanaurora vandensis]